MTNIDIDIESLIGPFNTLMRILIFLGFLALSILVPIGLAQGQGQPDLLNTEALIKYGNEGFGPSGVAARFVDGRASE